MRVIMQPQSPPCVTVYLVLGHCFSPKARLRTIFIIPKLEHELVARLSVLRETKAFLLYARGEAVVGERRSHNVESRTLLTAICKQREDPGDFDKATGPWTVSAGGVACLEWVTHSRGRRGEELHHLHRFSGARNECPKVRSRRHVYRF